MADDLPGTVYITMSDDDDPCLLAHEDVDDIEHDVVVGVYELKEMRVMVVTRELVDG